VWFTLSPAPTTTASASRIRDAAASLDRSPPELPAHDEPGEDLLRVSAKVGTEEGLGFKPSPRIADQHPASFCAVCSARRRNAPNGARALKKGKAQTREAQGMSAPTTSRTPNAARCSSRSAREWNGSGLGRRPCGCNLLSPTLLQGLIYAEDEGPFGDERLYEQSQSDAARFPNQPYSLAEGAMIAVKPFLLAQPIACKARSSPSSYPEPGSLP